MIERRFVLWRLGSAVGFSLFFNPPQMASNPHESQMEWM